MNIRISPKLLILIGLFLLAGALLAGCDASAQEARQTYSNQQKINAEIPVPNIDFSSRRLVLAKYYLVLARRRLETCTYVTGRGSFGEAVIPTYGPSVNLSDQMTDPAMAEPDTVHSGTKDQTVVIFRNGNFMVTEGDTFTFGGNCPEGVHLDTPLQKIADNAAGIKPEFDFTTTDGLLVP